MKFKTLKIDNSGILSESNFLSNEAFSYLNNNAELDIYNYINDKKNDNVSIAYPLNNSIIKKLSTINLLKNKNQYSFIKTGRNNIIGIDQIFFTYIFKYSFLEKINNFVVVLMDKDFKNKFNYDHTAITIDEFISGYKEFLNIVKPNFNNKIFIINLLDMNFKITNYKVGNKKFIKFYYEQK
tara:strand:- start:12211 stop:12756 length:546 start_codon:yes stop_codon:yes gene_type:complete